MAMTPANRIARDLMERLLAGERGRVPFYLGMLLEKSSPLAAGDEVYRQILPAPLADLRLSWESASDILAVLCAQVARNPDEVMIDTISWTGADLATRTAVRLLTSPPRPLTTGEYASALALVRKYLPSRLMEEPQFLPVEDLGCLGRILEALGNIDVEAGQADGRSQRIVLYHHANGLAEELRSQGMPGGGSGE